MDTPIYPKEKIDSPLLIIGALVLLTVGVSLLPASWLGIKKQVIHYEPLNLGALATYGTGEDANQDGTVSWKEFISQSLNLSPEEATATTSVQIDPRDLAALNDPNNLTSSFSKNFYIAQTALKQNGISDPQTEQQTVNQLLAQETARIQPSSYTKSDVIIASSNTSASLSAYGNAVAPILKSVLSEASMTSDLQSIAKYLQDADEAELIPILKDHRAASDALDKLLKLKVPSSAVDMHVTLLNAVGTFALTLQDMSTAQDDPMRATLALNKYMDRAVAVIRLFPSLGSFFKTQGIAFTTKDPGYVFVVGYTGK